jgi:hypothetical protein
MPALTALAEPLAVPTVLALFNHTEFRLDWDGGEPPCALLVAKGVDDRAAIVQAVSTIATALTNLKPLGALSWLPDIAGTVNQLTNKDSLGVADKLAALYVLAPPPPTLEKRPQLKAFAGAAIPLLEKHVFYDRLPWDRLSADNSLGSLFLIGAGGVEGRTASFHISTHYGRDDYEGSFDLRLPAGHILAVVYTLHHVPPGIEPGNALFNIGFPAEGTYGNRLSSLYLGTRPPELRGRRKPARGRRSPESVGPERI